MKKTILTFALLFFSVLNYAQNYYFEGVVLDDQLSTPVKGAIVTLKDTEFTEATDEDGKFVFTSQIPEGEFTVLVEKKDFETNIFFIDIFPGEKVKAQEIKLLPSKRELYNRKVASREAKKQQKIEAKKDAERIAIIEKELKEKEKKYAKQIKRLARSRDKEIIEDEDVNVTYENSADGISTPQENTYQISEIQEKYGKILGVDPTDLTNLELYNLIDDWDDVEYLWAGDTKETGIDCSSFTQFIYSSVYDFRIKRTARQQKESKSVHTFKTRDLIFEGDLIFFSGVGEDNDQINHVGVYLRNNMFVHSTSNKDPNGNNGVQISNLTDDYWSTRFVAAGRIILEN